MKKIASISGKAVAIIIIAVFFLWDAIPPATCNDENASLYTPKQMHHLAMVNRGIWSDEVEAACWINQSATNGNTNALSSVGINYEIGRGVEKNMHEAMKWYRRAIEKGNSGGAYRMALLYRDGNGVKASRKKSEKYFRLQKKMKITEPKYQSGSNVGRKFGFMYQAAIHADGHIARIFN